MATFKKIGETEVLSIQNKKGFHSGVIYPDASRAGWRIEVGEKFNHVEASRDQALAWARGAMIVIDSEE
jgi:hypothetical protein